MRKLLTTEGSGLPDTRPSRAWRSVEDHRAALLKNQCNPCHWLQLDNPFAWGEAEGAEMLRPRRPVHAGHLI